MLDRSGPLYEHAGAVTTPVSVGPSGVGAGPGNCYSRTGVSFCRYEVTPDGRTVAFMTPSSLVPEDLGDWDTYWRSGGVTRLVTTERPEDDGHSYSGQLEAMSHDGSRVFYRAKNYYERSSLYEWTASGVSEFPSEGTPAQDAFVYRFGASPDAGRVFFQTSASLAPGDDNARDDVYERTRDGLIELVSADNAAHAGGGYLVWASSDGSRAIFWTESALVPSDTDSEGDIYERRGGITTLLTPGTSSSLVPPRSGSSAWQAVYFLAASQDGARIFFESDEPLVPADTDGGEVDVYERSNGETKLISSSAVGPNAPTGVGFGGISADGTHVFFMTDERLSADDRDTCLIYTDAPPGCPDIYERVGDTTRLVTTGPAGVNANYQAGWFLAVSSDGRRVLFSTTEPLVASDRDSCDSSYQPPGCRDIYERHDGRTTLISTGPLDRDEPCGDFPDSGEPACPGLVGASDDGLRVFFTTGQSLTPGDSDGGLKDIYVSRVLPPGCRPEHRKPAKCAF
jgi:hypothetical protein